jgi:hypothetical protein
MQFTRERWPYGRWTTGDGDEVLYNRAYEPIWQRRPGGQPTVAKPWKWVHDIVKDELFFDDSTPPWRKRETRERCCVVLKEWGLPVPDAAEIVDRWHSDNVDAKRIRYAGEESTEELLARYEKEYQRRLREWPTQTASGCSPFGEWLQSRRAHATPRGDFIRDARNDRRFPVRCANWDELQSYLRDRNACDDAVRAGRRLWREYEKQNTQYSASP